MPAKVIVVFSTKGGVGKTLIASNLAVTIAKDLGRRVCLIDLDLQVVGDMATMLGLKPQRALVDLMNLMKTAPNSVRKDEFVTRNLSFGIDFIPAVLKPQQLSHLDATKIKDVFELLAKDYDYIIVDAGRNFSDAFVAVVNQANFILLVVTPDVLSVYQTKWTLDTIQFLHIPLSMVRIVLNRAEAQASISWQEIRDKLPANIIAQIPSEGKTVVYAINRGVPVVLDAPKTRVAMALKKLGTDIIGSERFFLKHEEIDQLKLREMPMERTGAWWDKEALTEALELPEVLEEQDEILRLKHRVHSRLIEELNIKKIDPKQFADPKKMKELRDKADTMVSNFLSEETGSFISSPEVRKKLVKEILDEALGLGPLEDLIADQSITDIMVNNKNEIFIERGGKITLTSKKFISNDQVRIVIERIIAPIGRRIDESVPLVDARLPDGSRVNAIIPPLSLTGPTLTIRKFRKERFKINDLIALNTIDPLMAEFLRACVVCRRNIIVSGGTGSGKTTVLNVLSEFIPEDERIISIEDAAELKLKQLHWVRLESRPPNIEGKGSISIRELFRNSLRMRPDRILIGECRSLETLDMLQAMNTGHDGSMTTVHANSTHDVVVRLDSMILMSGVELPIRAIREMVASAINVIVHTARLSDGTRKVTQITEVAGMKDDIKIDLRDIFLFKQFGMDKDGKILGSFQATGYVPSFIELVKLKGITLADNMFSPP